MFKHTYIFRHENICKNEYFVSHKTNEIITIATTWMDLEIIILSHTYDVILSQIYDVTCMQNIK